MTQSSATLYVEAIQKLTSSLSKLVLKDKVSISRTTDIGILEIQNYFYNEGFKIAQCP